ncbi:DUF4245 domain-containing protein [Streptomyces katsurahamanus]|uniref:DUF4245 domain-containing protein n=2 Tax=Streptomyces katsurahamanus TaxID=2577098 RepID=A0ABW9NUU3_9ACTN|nr:DUF4245 domain-containing protein [Streptomyces katsurahamanus]MQS36941.1 DUF4245 domain-containing protein [Streptomyces katsurahamanus]
MAGMRGRQTVRDMVLSMVAIGAVVGVIYLFLPNDEEADPVKAVDYGVELVTAQRAAPYPVVAPEGLPASWKATSVSYKGFEANAWHLGFLDPDREYVAVEQSTEAKGKFIPKVTHRAEDTGRTQKVNGETWQLWKGEKYDALVREEKGVTTVVTGTAAPERLTQMAEALESKPEPRPSRA